MSTSLFSELTLGPVEGFAPSFDGPPSDDGGPPERSPSSDGPQCEVCGQDIPWSGRGRRPKRCQDHKSRTRDTAGDDGGSATPRATAVDKRKQARLDKITGDLQEGLGELAGTIYPVAPVTAATIGIQGPPGMVSLVKIASAYPRFLDGLEKAATVVPFVAVGKFIVAVMLAIAVDMGRYEPIGLAAEYLRVAEAAAEVGWRPREEMQQEAAQVDRSVPPPPRFKL